MKKEILPLREVSNFSSFFLDYLEGKEKLSDFYNKKISIENLLKQSEEKSFSQEKRELLHRQLTEQYASTKIHPSAKKNLDLLKDSNTFTITTGHQLNIFTGPLYFIYKIVSTINACKELTEKYPDKNFIPIYWAATEDHDFEEINHFHLFNKKYEWSSEEKGAVGRFSTDGLEKLIEELPEKSEPFQIAYSKKTLSEAAREYINELFGAEGLVMIDGDDKYLKAEFAPVIKDEITQHKTSKIVTETNEKIHKLNYKTQVNPREINLFFLKDGLRERIVKEGDTFRILNTEFVFSKTEILSLVDTNPEYFSPNVILRPLYQESVLPNLAYIGGPSELVYWLQLKPAFDYHKLEFPILMPRNFALILDETQQRKIKKLNLEARDFFLNEKELKSLYIERLEKENKIDFSEEVQNTEQLFSSLIKKIEKVDKSLIARAASEKVKTLQAISTLEKKLNKAYEQKNEAEIKQIINVKNKLFPNNGLQERQDNFLNFYFNYPLIIKSLLANLEPYNPDFNLVFLDEKERS